MKLKHKPKYISILVIILIILAILGTYFNSLSKIEIEDVKVNYLEEISLEGFTLTGEILINHKGFIPAEIDRIEYFVSLDSTNTTLANGNISKTYLKPKEITHVPISVKINWVPTIDAALKLIKNQENTITISGTIYIIESDFVNIKIPFEETVNINEYLKQFAKYNVKDVIKKTIDWFN